MKYSRQTKIICTMGPASSSKEVLLKMAQAGMDVARINFSHGDHVQHQALMDLVRGVNTDGGYNIKILQDLEGYRIRIGRLKKPIELKKGEIVAIVHGMEQSGDAIPMESDADLSSIKKGMTVFADDGLIALEVVKSGRARLQLRVVHGGVLKSRKGVNIPGFKFQANILTAKDKGDIDFGLKNKVDFVAQSFVRNRDDILRVAKLVKTALPACRIFAKIESEDGVRNTDAIMDACDGILIARGDLGVSLPIYRIPVIQKSIIRRCNKQKKYSITATQMLESMTENSRPTRAEVSDVANAIFDGTDYVMLSAETAAGRFPVESVRMMAQVVEYTEKSIRLHDC